MRNYNIINSMIDVHCHLDWDSFKDDLDDVLKRAEENGVSQIINVGTSIEASKKVIDLANKYQNLFAIVGVHPHSAGEVNNDGINELEILLKNRKVLAVGEIGLDFFKPKNWEITNPSIQEHAFRSQIELAIKNNLPIQIHCRQAQKQILTVISDYRSQFSKIPGMFHCFSGDEDFLKKVLDLGFYIGFDGNITYGGIAPGETTSLIDLVKYAPIDRIVAETDAPFLTPIPYKGSRNEPSYVIMVRSFIAKIKGISEEEVEEKTVKNTRNLFKI